MSLCKVTTGNPSNTSKFCKARLLDSKHSFFYRLLLVKFLNKTCFLIQVRAGGTAKIHSKNMPTLPWLWRLNWLFLICIHDRLPMFSGEALVLQAKPKVCNFSLPTISTRHSVYWKTHPADLCAFLCPNQRPCSSVQHKADYQLAERFSDLLSFPPGKPP